MVIGPEEAEIAARIGPAFGYRRLPRIRGVKGTSNRWVVVETRRTRRAAFRAARERRRHTGVGYRVFPLPRKPGRRTVDWAVAEPKHWLVT